jgi:hypothetical protein
VEQCQNGYPRLAAFKASDHNFMIYRSFSYLHARCLLYIQDELACLERTLDKLDEAEARDSNIRVRKRLKARCKDDWENGQRKQLVTAIKRKLDEYGAFPSSPTMLTLSNAL